MSIHGPCDAAGAAAAKSGPGARYPTLVLVTTILASSLAFGAACLVLAWVRNVPLVAAALLVAGYCWIAINSSMNASAQAVLPDWVRSRGMTQDDDIGTARAVSISSTSSVSNWSTRCRA